MSDDPSDPFADIEPPDWGLVARHLAGEASDADAARLEAWVARDARRRVWLEAMRETWREAGRPAQAKADGGALADAVWARVRAAGADDAGVAQVAGARTGRAPTLTVLGGPQRTRVILARVVGIAAALIVAVGGALAISRGGWLAPTQQFREFASARGARTTITLHDGTRFVLGPDTRLRVSSDFGVATRTVELDGEALFTVVHDERHPFAVRTQRTTVRDVGTTFVVRAYRDDREERVAVGEGEVALGGVALRARDMASVDAGGQVSVRRGVDVAPYLNWVQGALTFKDTPLGDVVRDLARTYDLDVTVADSALDQALVSASFSGESADEVLGVVTRIVGAHYTRNGRAVVIRRGVVPAARRGGAGDAVERVARAAVER